MSMSEVASHIEKAEQLFKKGEYLKAAGAWTRAIKQDQAVKDDPLLQSNMCYALLKAHKFTKALEAAEASLALDANQGVAHYRHGLCLISLERWDEAVLALTGAQALLGSQDPDCMSMLANSKFQCRIHHERAGTECPKSCRDAPDPQARAKEGKENAKPKSEVQVKKEVKRRMAAKLAAEKAERQQHHAKKLNQTLAALQTAQRELLTQEKMNAAQEIKKADLKSVEGLTDSLVSEEDYSKIRDELRDGEALPYDSSRVHRFAAHELQSVNQLKDPTAIVLSGVKNSDWGNMDEGQGVHLIGGFESEKQQQNTGLWVQRYATETDSHAILLVVPKAKLLFPKKLEGWDCATKGGFYVQLETKQAEDRRMWFVAAEGEATQVDLDGNSGLLDDFSKKKKKAKGKK